MVRNKQKLIDHIRNTPFDELESELKEVEFSNELVMENGTTTH